MCEEVIHNPRRFSVRLKKLSFLNQKFGTEYSD